MSLQVLIIGNEPFNPYMRPPLSKELFYNEDRTLAKSLKFKQWNASERRYSILNHIILLPMSSTYLPIYLMSFFFLTKGKIIVYGNLCHSTWNKQSAAIVYIFILNYPRSIILNRDYYLSDRPTAHFLESVTLLGQQMQIFYIFPLGT